MTQREPPNFGSYRPNEGRAPPSQAQRPSPAPRPPAQARANGVREAAPRQQRRGLLGVALWSLAGLAAALVVGAVLLVVFAPTGFIRDQLIAQVKAKTGRDLIVDGPTSLSFLPSLSVAMADVSLSSPPGMQGAPMVRMAQLQVDIPLLPLLRRELQIERLILTQPVIELRVDKAGRRNWDFASWSARPVRYAQATGHKTDAPIVARAPAGQFLGSLENVSLGDVRLVDGIVRYIDERAGTAEEIRAVDLTVRGERLTDPLAANGKLTWRGERVDLSLDIATPRAILTEQLARVRLHLLSNRLKLGLDGNLLAGERFKLEGKLDGETTSVRALATWLGATVPAMPGLGPLRISGQLSATPADVALSGASIRLDKATGAGDVSIRHASVRPDIRASLSIDVLDLNDYLPQDGTADGETAPTPSDGGMPAPPRSIDDLLRRENSTPVPGRFSPQVKGYTKRAGWSEEPISLDILRLFDATVHMKLGKLIYRDIKTGRTSVDVSVKTGIMQSVLREIELYEGRGSGQVRIDAANALPQLAANFSLDGLAGLAFLTDATGFDWIDGRVRIQTALTGQGTSQKVIMSSLGGRVSVTFSDGAIVGYNLPKMIRGLQQGQFGGFDRLPAERTDFSSLTSTYQITNGVATNKDLRLESPLLRVSGEGTIDIAGQALDYLLRPRVVANLSGQGGRAEASGIEIPFKITGPWEKPKVTPVLDAVIKNPGAVVDAVKDLADKFKNKKGVSDALKGLLGRGQQNEEGTKPTTDQLLKQLFR